MWCGKVRHPTKGGALTAWRKSGKNTQINVYFCKQCKAWHLGNSNGPLRKMDRISQLLERVL